jgi:hypothetical protein
MKKIKDALCLAMIKVELFLFENIGDTTQQAMIIAIFI